ncbi:DUF3298 and DUF4163 domain-containing protein [Dyadobacter sp. CY107]|uniref:DUF3298 and DUF4163 domain-containing protein n=1 Tax=Dyadobacter fanqingshengii TaxID=2906443 RepID=UPI001F3B5E97|nr:DUF3298 and DUF4163 domain-containing protein [Dyadobacter fanqingshengii]MCF2502842.1 DUF3298 and DUF4163 domain-containing protein [Dyadobacter fanqingshengii]
MHLNKICFFLFAISFLAGCNRSGKSENEESGKVKFVGAKTNTQFGGCDTVQNKGISIKLNLWEPSDSSKTAEAIRATLTQKSLRRINSYGDSASIAANPQAGESVKSAFEVFEKNYNDFKKDFPDAPGCWEVELKGDTIFSTSKALFYQLDHYAFTGGAHPNTFRSYHAFDAKTGAEIEMKNFISDSTALLSLVNKAFRKTEKLSAETDLEEAGYFLVNHKFVLPVAYVFTPEGILFYYNPYEIAAYARGAIQFTIPYAELGDVIEREKVF